MKLTLNLKAERAGGHMSRCLLGWVGWRRKGGRLAVAMRCCSCVCDFWINFNAPLSGFRVTLPSVWGPVEMTSEQALTTARGTQRSLGAGESVYERFITDVTLICHALSGSCSKAHIVNGFFLWLKSSLAKSCRWDGDCLRAGVDCGGEVGRQTSTLCEQMRRSTLWAALPHVHGEMDL